MPPNSDISNLRHRFNNANNDAADSSTDEATVSVTPLKNIKGTEVVINNTIYDLTSFDHPGGDSVYIFGGNDVTVQYKMIHPYHTEHHLKKMKAVGFISNKEAESE